MFGKSGSTVSPRALGALLLASGLLGVGCGKGSGNTSGPPSSPTPVQTHPAGIWRGTLASTNPAEGKAALAFVSPAGDVRIISEAGFHYVSGGGLFNLGTAFAPAGKAFRDGSTQAAIASRTSHLEAASTSSSSSAGAASGTYAFSCKIPGDAVWFESATPDPSYTTPMRLADLSGTYASQAADNSLGHPLSLVVDGGTGTVAVPGGDAFTVAFTLPDPARSAVDLTLTYSPAGLTTENPVPGNGACVLASGGAERTLIFGAAGGTRSFCGKFTKRLPHPTEPNVVKPVTARLDTAQHRH